MTSKRIGVTTGVFVALAGWLLVSQGLRVDAQTPSAKEPARATVEGRETTLTGQIVDIHGFMTGQYASADRAKCTADCIRAGVPAGLVTEQGVVILGQGTSSPSRTLLPWALRQVEVRGHLFEKQGVKYLNVDSIVEPGAKAEPKADE